MFDLGFPAKRVNIFAKIFPSVSPKMRNFPGKKEVQKFREKTNVKTLGEENAKVLQKNTEEKLIIMI